MKVRTGLRSTPKVTYPGIRFRIEFGPRSGVGPGKIALLEQIERCGSLSQAARNLNMSYRRAWQLLDSLNRCFLEPVVRTSKGGRGGGGAIERRLQLRGFLGLRALCRRADGDPGATPVSRLMHFNVLGSAAVTPAARVHLGLETVPRNLCHPGGD